MDCLIKQQKFISISKNQLIQQLLNIITDILPQLQAKMNQNNIKYSYSFLNKFSIQAKIPDTNDVILCCRDTQELVLMKQIEVTPQEYEETLATLEYQKKLSHQQLLLMIDYHSQPHLNKFIVLYQYCSINLQEQFNNRLNEHRHFSQTQLWSIFTSLIFGLSYLQEQNVGHGSVSLKDCFINEQGFIKISDPTCATSNPYTVVKGYFYAPQILGCLVNETGQQINIFKSDIFALGCCMLQLSLMRDVSNIFNYDTGKIDCSILDFYKDELKALNLSPQYTKFIHQITCLDVNKRPDFVKLKQQIFSLLSIDPQQKNQMLKKSFSIKSSISSLCRSKGQQNLNINIKQPADASKPQQVTELGRQFLSFGNLKTPQLQQKINTNMFGSNLLDFDPNIKNLDFFKVQPNVDHLFGNLKKSIHLEGQTQKIQNQQQYISPSIQKNKQQTKASQFFYQKDQSSNHSKKYANSQQNQSKVQFQEMKKAKIRQPREQKNKKAFLEEINNFRNCIKKQQQKCNRLTDITNSSKTTNSQILTDTPRLSNLSQNLNLGNTQKLFQKQKTSKYDPSFNSNVDLSPFSYLKQNSKKIQSNKKSQYDFIYEAPYRYSFVDSREVSRFHKEKFQMSRRDDDSYTNPDFLKMMQTDVQEIMNRRKLL